MNWDRLAIQLGLWSLLAMAGCNQNKPQGATPAVQAEAQTDEETDKHNDYYLRGTGLLKPYMQLVGSRAKPTNTQEAQAEVREGIELLKKVVQINPDNWNAYWVIGKGYQALHESENACNAFLKAYKINSNHPDVAREYMYECLILGRAKEAIDAAVHAMELKPEDAGLVANAGLAYLIAGQLEDADRTVDRALKMAPDDQMTQSLKTVIGEIRSGKRPQPKNLIELEK